MDPEKVTLAEALELIAKKAAAGPAKRSGGRTTAKKKAPAKSAKKTPAKARKKSAKADDTSDTAPAG